MRPDGRYTLDLSVWEDRVVAHSLVQLAVAEPGENWVGTFFAICDAQPRIERLHPSLAILVFVSQHSTVAVLVAD